VQRLVVERRLHACILEVRDEAGPIVRRRQHEMEEVIRLVALRRDGRERHATADGPR
jgi:hypothetical protein